MVFSSVSFLFLFLPIFLLIYHLGFFLSISLGSTRQIWWRLSNAFLLLASLLFYFWGEGNKVWIFIATTLVDFLAALAISGSWYTSSEAQPRIGRSRMQTTILTLSICSNLLVLIWFKYLNFGMESMNGLFRMIGLGGIVDPGFTGIVLPLGISFFTFHSMSYTIDVYRGEVKPTRNFIDYACYVLMFPQLVAGPIVRYSYVAKSLTERRVSLTSFASGAVRFALGLGKKILIANTVARATDKIFALPLDLLSPSVAWIGVIAYTLQIYFDFSGYSDMAIGLGRMLGFELPQNFSFPYISRSIREFWRRWHISLSTWFQDYLYIPLGGNRVSPVRNSFNLLTVFLLCGLWHGAKWTFVAWGLYHGLFLVFERQPLVSRMLDRSRWGSHIYTLLVVVCGWTLFRADTFSQAIAFFKAMTGIHPAHTAYSWTWFLQPDLVVAGLAGIVFSAPVSLFLSRWLDSALGTLPETGRRPAIVGLAFARYAGVFAILFLSCMSLSSGTYNPFIYFRF
jgi:alginate O-acetyltransferase complex protein AlgI